ncbi:hypothetical protein VTJ83DRAFT_7431 [Remersonia thermophila]|uniref:Uncharacterized protein n=1 Tax=Remersonia thermophila TaxID=72144 RepID=A0ABR4D505_9PEZI
MTMEVTSRSRLQDTRVKAEDDTEAEKPTYRSWKKKYRKMRIIFDQKMHEGEELHRLEQKALATAKRLAVQKDRLLDILLDVNNSRQIPPEKRIDLSLDPPSDAENDALLLDIDRPSTPPPGPPPATSYRKLLKEVPHYTFASAAEHCPEFLADLEAGRDSPADPAQGASHPPSFLTADDIDNYIWELDTQLANEKAAAAASSSSEPNQGPKKDAKDAAPSPLPTLAPLAHASSHQTPRDTQRDFALRNPVSVYNWLRKHAPKTFLQDGEHDKEGAGGKENGDDHPGSARRAKAGGGDRASRPEKGSASARGASKRSRAAAAAAVDSFEDPDDDASVVGGPATPVPGGAKGAKRKRVVDDDPGYRPKGGSSRPSKKKRKSDGAEKTPSGGKGAKKSEAASAAYED